MSGWTLLIVLIMAAIGGALYEDARIRGGRR